MHGRSSTPEWLADDEQSAKLHFGAQTAEAPICRLSDREYLTLLLAKPEPRRRGNPRELDACAVRRTYGERLARACEAERSVFYLTPLGKGKRAGQRRGDFRKAWATAFKAGGVPERAAMKVTGHKTRAASTAITS